MNSSLLIENFNSKFHSVILGSEQINLKRMIISIKPEAIVRAADYLFREAGLRFIIASAIHTRRGFEIHYHFSHDQDGLILNLHVILNSEKPEIESLSNLFNASNWIEREMHELFGINFLNHPNQDKLISEGNWAEGVYPYRKDFKTSPGEKL